MGTISKYSKKNFTVFSLVLALALPSWAIADGEGYSFPSEAARSFIRAEAQNSYKPSSTVNEAYRPAEDRIFPIKFLEIPAEDLNVADSGQGSAATRDHFFFEKDGKKYVRFFIHPDSEHLYQPLIDKYGVGGTYLASPTSSTRSMLAWDPKKPASPPVFLKLSLAQHQDQMVRVIPGWEVRRSVGISGVVSATPERKWLETGSSIIPEFSGAYVTPEMNLPVYVDKNQGTIREHGLIARDGSFLKQFEDKAIQPLFSLFTERAGGKEPELIEQWKKSGKDFYSFADEFLFKPFIEKNMYLMFEEGIAPEIHGQNVVLVRNPKTGAIEHLLHRDVGSMKVNLPLRWINDLGVERARTPNAAYDFKFAEAVSKYEHYFDAYFNDWLFRWGYLDMMRKHIPDFDPEKTKALIKKRLREAVRAKFPIRDKSFVSTTVEAHMKKYFDENPPRNLRLVQAQGNPETVRAFIASQQTKKQVMELPASWARVIPLGQEGYAVTEYGVVFQGPADASGNRKLMLAFHASPNMAELHLPVAVPKPAIAVAEPERKAQAPEPRRPVAAAPKAQAEVQTRSAGGFSGCLASLRRGITGLFKPTSSR